MSCWPRRIRTRWFSCNKGDKSPSEALCKVALRLAMLERSGCANTVEEIFFSRAVTTNKKLELKPCQAPSNMKTRFQLRGKDGRLRLFPTVASLQHSCLPTAAWQVGWSVTLKDILLVNDNLCRLLTLRLSFRPSLL